MRAIGGELELRENNHQSYFTDSGRSSLKLFIRSKKNSKKKYLIPDFLCEVIETVLKEASAEYAFYHILDDLTIDSESVKNKEYDVLYVINYFGDYMDLSNLEWEEKILIEDNVFMYNFENRTHAKYWYAFNSFRKITVLAEGSLVKTTLEIDDNLIEQGVAPFSDIKYEAKSIKYNYIHYGQGKETNYLKKFKEAENMLDNQKKIYNMSSNSLAKMITFHVDEEQKILKKRYDIMLTLFKKYAVVSTPAYYSFLILKIKNRDEIRRRLMAKNIFLAAHWTQGPIDNILYQELVSIPLFTMYNDEEFQYLAQAIKDVL